MSDVAATSVSDPAGNPCQSDLGWALGTVLRAYVKASSAAVDEIPGGPRGYQVLGLAAAPESWNQSSIAHELGVDRTVMTYLLDDLERAGLVVRRADPADRRSRQVLATDHGLEVLDRLVATMAAVEREVLAHLDDAEVGHFKSLLTRVATGSGLEFNTACAAVTSVLPELSER